MPVYLDFEKKIEELDEQMLKLKEIESKGEVDISVTMKELETKITETKKEIYEGLTPWQRVQVSRHPERPYTLAYINSMTDGNFIELHGDRGVKDDKAMVGGFGLLDGQ